MFGTAKLVEKQIVDSGRGSIFFIQDFLSYDSQGGVRIALSHLVKDGLIERLARGIYCYPKIDERNMRVILPDPEIIALTLAAKENVRIIPYGDMAAYKLGLSGIRISELKYLTDGAPRRILLSKGRKIFFNHTSEVKIFAYKNEMMQTLTSAIRVLGRENIGQRERMIIREHLSRVNDKDFNTDIILPPAWVQEILIDER